MTVPVHPFGSAVLDASPANSARSIRTFFIPGPAGKLEAVLNEGQPNSSFAAIVCHPHPAGGGTLHNKVVYHAMKVLNDPAWGFAMPMLRFNFRGTGLSEGEHHGADEVADVSAVMRWIENEYNLPTILCGFSFGGAMSIAACCSGSQASPRALIALGLPIKSPNQNYEYPSLASCKVPKLFLSGDRDEFAPLEALQQTVASAAEPKRLITLSNCDHFFTGQLSAMQQNIADWLHEELL